MILDNLSPEAIYYIKKFFDENKEIVNVGGWDRLYDNFKKDTMWKGIKPGLLFEILEEAGVDFNINGWFRIHIGKENGSRKDGYELIIYKTKTKGVMINFKEKSSLVGSDCPIFFRSIKDAQEFINKYNGEINGYKFSLRDVYRATLNRTTAESGFAKVSTRYGFGDIYFQAWKAEPYFIDYDEVVPA